VQEVEEAGEDEEAGRGADRRALGQAGGLLGQLRLGERDLLADEQRGLLGDLLDRLAELGCLWVRHGFQSTSLLRMRAIRNAPAKATPAATSGRSSGLDPVAVGAW